VHRRPTASFIAQYHFRKRHGLRPLGRREFLRLVTVGAAGLSLPLAASCDSKSGSDDHADGGASDGASGDAGRQCPDCATVGIARKMDVSSTVRDAIEMAGGLGDIKGGDRVVIKPNNTAPIAGAFTSVAVLRAVIQAVSAHTDPKHITLAECSAFGFDSTEFAGYAGYLQLCEEEGVRFTAWDRETYVGFRDPDWKFIKEEKRVPKMLDPSSPGIDHFINAPVLKNHDGCPWTNAVFTTCIKNFVGILPYQGEGGRMTPGEWGIHDENLGEQSAELGRIVPRITMNVVDGTTVGVKNGPAGKATPHGAQDGPLYIVDAGLALASKDRVACDSVALAVLKHYAKREHIDRAYVNRSVWEDAQLRRAAELGLGTDDPAKIDIIDDGVDEISGIRDNWI
jgi:uncharacterized protein (DUF362 family)